MRVEVVFALERLQTVLSVDLPDGSTTRQAIVQSGILAAHPDIEIARNDIGIWGRRARLDTVLVEGDRVEIYRPLKADPRVERRQRALRSKKT